MVERRTIHGQGEVADGGDHQAAGDLVMLAGADGAAVLDPRALEAHRFHVLAAQDFDRAREEDEVHALRLLVGLPLGEGAERLQVLLAHAPVAR